MKRNCRKNLQSFLQILVALLCVLVLISGFPNQIHAEPIDKDRVEISKPVEPFDSPNASDLLDLYPQEGPIETIPEVPEGEPLPVEPPPERRPTIDPEIQLDDGGYDL